MVQQAATLKKVYRDIPVMMFEGDMTDYSSYNEAEVHNRIDAFIESLEQTRARG